LLNLAEIKTGEPVRISPVLAGSLSLPKNVLPFLRKISVDTFFPGYSISSRPPQLKVIKVNMDPFHFVVRISYIIPLGVTYL
jgi:hypothetical protein